MREFAPARRSRRRDKLKATRWAMRIPLLESPWKDPCSWSVGPAHIYVHEERRLPDSSQMSLKQFDLYLIHRPIIRSTSYTLAPRRMTDCYAAQNPLRPGSGQEVSACRKPGKKWRRSGRSATPNLLGFRTIACRIWRKPCSTPVSVSGQGKDRTGWLTPRLQVVPSTNQVSFDGCIPVEPFLTPF